MSQWEIDKRRSELQSLHSKIQRLATVWDAYVTLRHKWQALGGNGGNDNDSIHLEHRLLVPADSTVTVFINDADGNGVSMSASVVGVSDNSSSRLLGENLFSYVDQLVNETSAITKKASKQMSKSSYSSNSNNKVSPRYLRSQHPTASNNNSSNSNRKGFFRDDGAGTDTNGTTATGTSASSSSSLASASSEEVEAGTTVENTVFSCESLLLRASSDLRLPIPLKGVSR